ncbi:MAG: hypothetical protein ABT940_08590 [Alphaproteobacteria bacterium]
MSGTGTVAFTLNKAVATSFLVGIVVQTGSGQFAIQDNLPLQVTINRSFTNLSVTPNQVYVYTGAGAVFTGQITLQIQPLAGTPSVWINNVTENTTTVTWPTSSGSVTQALTPGTPFELYDFTTSDG